MGEFSSCSEQVMLHFFHITIKTDGWIAVSKLVSKSQSSQDVFCGCTVSMLGVIQSRNSALPHFKLIGVLNGCQREQLL